MARYVRPIFTYRTQLSRFAWSCRICGVTKVYPQEYHFSFAVAEATEHVFDKHDWFVKSLNNLKKREKALR